MIFEVIKYYRNIYVTYEGTFSTFLVAVAFLTPSTFTSLKMPGVLSKEIAYFIQTTLPFKMLQALFNRQQFLSIEISATYLLPFQINSTDMFKTNKPCKS
tara:strand:+ start:2410 stop:2709 length:300 start_codon:yes stop_codon:yes gene_type:complete